MLRPDCIDMIKVRCVMGCMCSGLEEMAASAIWIQHGIHTNKGKRPQTLSKIDTSVAMYVINRLKHAKPRACSLDQCASFVLQVWQWAVVLSRAPSHVAAPSPETPSASDAVVSGLFSWENSHNSLKRHSATNSWANDTSKCLRYL